MKQGHWCAVFLVMLTKKNKTGACHMKIDLNVNVHLQSIYKISAETDFDGFVGVCDEGDEQAEHHVDEERCEGV